jgi:predicted nucleotidyltransferase
MSLHIQVNREQIADFCRRHHMRKLAFFGSVLRDDFRADSDVDVLIEFEPEYRLGLFELMRIQREFSVLIGREADFRTPEDLGRYMRNRVISESEVQYAA